MVDRHPAFLRGSHSFYPLWVKNFIQWELGSRILFWLAAIVALAVMPWEFKIAAGVLLLARLRSYSSRRGASAAAWVKRKSADVTSCTTC